MCALHSYTIVCRMDKRKLTQVLKSKVFIWKTYSPEWMTYCDVSKIEIWQFWNKRKLLTSVCRAEDNNWGRQIGQTKMSTKSKSTQSEKCFMGTVSGVRFLQRLRLSIIWRPATYTKYNPMLMCYIPFNCERGNGQYGCIRWSFRQESL